MMEPKVITQEIIDNYPYYYVIPIYYYSIYEIGFSTPNRIYLLNSLIGSCFFKNKEEAQKYYHKNHGHFGKVKLLTIKEAKELIEQNLDNLLVRDIIK